MVWAKSPGIVDLPTGAQARFVPASNVGSAKMPVVLVVHGWRSAGDRRYPAAITEQGYHALYLTLRGHGGAVGDILKVTRQDHLEDALAAVEYLRTRTDVDMDQLCAFGSSYGAYIVALLAGEVPLKLIAMRVPANYPDQGWDEPIANLADDASALKPWRSLQHEADENRALAGLAGFGGRLFIVQSEDDEYVPPMVARNYSCIHRQPSSSLVVMLGAKHQLEGAQIAEFNSILGDWFRNNYPSPSVTS